MLSEANKEAQALRGSILLTWGSQKARLILPIIGTYFTWHRSGSVSAMKDTRYTITGNMVTVCAWCYPNLSIYEACPEIPRHLELSHGICRRHRIEQVKAILDAERSRIEYEPS